jgi:hypothetical protein
MQLSYDGPDTRSKSFDGRKLAALQCDCLALDKAILCSVHRLPGLDNAAIMRAFIACNLTSQITAQENARRVAVEPSALKVRRHLTCCSILLRDSSARGT